MEDLEVEDLLEPPPDFFAEEDVTLPPFLGFALAGLPPPDEAGAAPPPEPPEPPLDPEMIGLILKGLS